MFTYDKKTLNFSRLNLNNDGYNCEQHILGTSTEQ